MLNHALEPSNEIAQQSFSDPPRQSQREALRAERGGGPIEHAFGFDLSPLVARAAEFASIAETARDQRRARYLLREELGRQKRLKTLPLPIRQLVTCHIAEMGI
jgi:Replication protein C N-terminal domain